MAEDNTKLVDGEGQAHPIITSTEAGGSTAIGYQSHAEGTDSTAIGNNAKINDKLVTYYADKDGNQTTSMDDAAWYKDDNGNPTRKPPVFRDADDNTTTTPQYKYTHTVTAEDGTTSTVTDITTDVSKADKDDKGNLVYNYNPYDNTSYLYSVQLYQSAANSIAAGTNVTANGSSAVAVGDSAKADGNSTIAIGTGAKAADTSAGGTGSIAIGKGVEANGSSTAVGLNGTKATYGSSAYGNNAASQNSSAAFGSNVQASNGSYASGMGTADKPVTATESSYATGMGGTTATNGSIAFGNNVKAGDKGGGAFAVGMGGTTANSGSMAVGNNVKAGENGGGAFAVGMGGTTANSGSMAVGNNVKAGENSGGAFAVGMGGTSADGSSMAVGDNVHATGSAFASGRNGTSAQSGGIAYGDNVSAQYGGFAAGTNSTSASSGVAVGSNVHASDGSSYAGGMNNTTAANGSIAFGNNVSGSGGAFAAGMNGTTADGSSVAVGDNVHASSGSYAAGMGGTSASSSAVAIGNNAHAYGNSYVFGSSASADSSAVAIGNNAHAYGNSYVFGSSASADSSSAAIGNSSYATNSSLALGNSAGAYVSGGIALGSNSTVYRGATPGLDPRNGQPSENTTPTWKSTYGALSIGAVDSSGNVTGTRQIIGVAAGTNDTDAVNMAQLKQVAQGFSIHDYGVNSIDTTTDTNYNNAGAVGNNSLAAGVSASASAEDAVAIGYGAKAEGVGATVIGQYGEATGRYALAFGGQQTDATAEQANNVASGDNAVSFGERTTASGANATAFGQETKATEKRATAFGQRTQAIQSNATAFGIDTIASGQNATAFGNLTQASAIGATAFGNKNQATGQYATAWGGGDKVVKNEDGTTSKIGTVASGTYATAFGERTLASGESATAFGSDSTASGKNSLSFGENSTAAAKNSLAALGGTVDAAATNAAAIGSGAQAKLADSIALGSGSVADRASGAKGYDMLTKGDTTNTSAAWVANANAIAVGNGSTLTRQITGVAAGSLDTDAVNVAQLKAAGFKVTTQKNGDISSSILNGDTLDFEGINNAIVSTTKDSKTITVAVSKTPTFDSATFYNPNPAEGQNNEKVTIANGQISAFNPSEQKRAVIGVDNEGNGSLSLVNNDLSTVQVYTQNSANQGNDGITRMYYVSSSGNGGEIQGVHTIAVLDDGINYTGDNLQPGTTDKVVVKHKLNSTMDVTGGADTSNLSEGNIGVVATPAVEDEQGNITQKGKLEIKLNKDLQDLNSVTAGNVRIGNNPANTLQLTEKGQETENTAPAGNYATGLDNKAWDTKNPSYVSGRAATEDQLAIVSGVVDKGLSFTANTKDATNTTDNYAGYKVVNRQLGDTISIKAGDADPNMKYETKNLTSQIAENGDITISMADKPTFSEVTANSFNLSPKDTTTKDQAGNTASAQLNAHYRDASLNPDKNVTMADSSTGMVRLHYHDGEGTVHDLATMDDGQIYAGDIKADGTEDTTGFGRRMNQKTTINGGVTNKDNLSDNNIGVVSDGTSTLTVKLAKNLQNLESVQAGKTTIDDKGLTIKKSDDDSSKNVVVLGDKVAFGDNQVNNMGSGSDGTGTDGKPSYNNLTNGANIGDVKNIASSTVQPVIDTVNKGWELDVNSTKQKAVTPDSPTVNLIQGQNITITGDTTSTENVTIATADDVRFNTVRVGGVNSDTGYTGGIVIGKQSGGDSANPDENDYITGLKNTNWDSNKIQSGRAATEDQLKKVADDIKQGTVAGDVYVTGGEVSYHTDGGTDNGQPTVNDGTGKLTLTENNKTSKVEITGLHDYYVTNGTVTDDGKTLELTRNDVDKDGNHQKISIDLSNVLSNDQHLVTNPDATDGKYVVNTTDGTVTLKVKNGDKYDNITIGGFEGLGKGLKFGANKMAKDGGGNPVTNQLGSTINITGAGTKGLTDYSGKNLLTSVEQDADGNTIVHVLMDKNISADGVTVGQAGKDGVAGTDGEVGKAGTIGINGKNGVTGDDDKEGITTTIIHTEKGQPGENGTTGKPGVDGKDITRIVYQNDQDKVDGKDGSHTVATLDDGLKFSGDDNRVITKKLNEQLQFVGGADKNKLTQDNIGINELEDGKLTIQLVNTPNLGDKGNLKAGDAQIGWFNGDVLTRTDGTQEKQGSYATGLDNKDWNMSSPSYVSGRAATEDQLAQVSAAINNAATAAGKRTVVTVNDKANPAEATPKDGDYGDYDSTNGNLMIAAKKDADGVLTYNIKLNDNLALGKESKDGTDGQEGTIGLTGKDGLPGTDGKQRYSTTIIKTEKGQAGKDGKTGKENLSGTDITRIVYTDKDGQNAQTVATLDDGLKFVGNDGQEVTRKLNTTLSIKGGITDATDLKNASAKNLGVRKSGDGLEIVMTDTPDFEKVTVGKDAAKKITIGEQTVTGKKADGSDADKPQTGNYITGLDNKAWDKDNIVENRAATEGQLKEAINEISGKDKGGFGLADEKGGTVKKDLGDTIAVKGDSKNIETKVKDGALEVSLKKDVDLGGDGSIKAGNTTVNSDGVDTNKVIIKDSTINITKDGINAGSKRITNVESGGDVDTNAANIGDVKRIAGDMKTEITNNATDVTNKVNKMGDELTQVQKDVKADRQYLGDEGTAKKVNVKFGSALSLTGGAKVDSLAGEGNIGVIQKEMDDPDHAGEKINGFSIRLAKDLTGLNSVTTGNTTINNSGLTVKTGDANRTITVQDGKVDMGGNQIHNVAPGKAPTDAVNVSQLQQTGRAINQLGSSVNKLGARVDRVGANSAALAALHPLDFDPDDKLDFAVGAGSYSGANAVALGAFYRPNEDVMFSLGGSTGGGENMVNIGATFKLGQHNHVSNSRVAMAKEIRGLKELVAKQEGEMQQLKTLMNQMAGRTVMKVDKDALFPDIPENHWAYDYVTKLAKAGIVEGYEDGEFKGNRMMTRYEFAAVIYRAIMAGAGSNPALDQDGTLGKLVKEFDGELKYIRIDVIEKDKHGNPTIERVRTVEDSEKHHGK